MGDGARWSVRRPHRGAGRLLEDVLRKANRHQEWEIRPGEELRSHDFRDHARSSGRTWIRTTPHESVLLELGLAKQ